jgi:serine/threonine protein kinase
VALKVLTEAFASAPDRLARFEREAKVLASLNHPNFGTIYGLEAADGVKALSLCCSLKAGGSSKSPTVFGTFARLPRADSRPAVGATQTVS